MIKGKVRMSVRKDAYRKMEEIAREKGMTAKEVLQSFISIGLVIEAMQRKGRIIIEDEEGNRKHEIIP